jgi:hypothetical protein
MNGNRNGNQEIEARTQEQTAFAFGHINSFLTTYAASIGVTWKSLAGGVGTLLLDAAGGPGLGAEYQMPGAGVRDHAALRGNVRLPALALDDGAHNGGTRKAAALIQCPECPLKIPSNGMHKHLMGRAHGWTAGHYRKWARKRYEQKAKPHRVAGRRGMSAAARKRMSDGMKARWAERKRAAATAA